MGKASHAGCSIQCVETNLKITSTFSASRHPFSAASLHASSSWLNPASDVRLIASPPSQRSQTAFRHPHRAPRA